MMIMMTPVSQNIYRWFIDYFLFLELFQTTHVIIFRLEIMLFSSFNVNTYEIFIFGSFLSRFIFSPPPPQPTLILYSI